MVWQAPTNWKSLTKFVNYQECSQREIVGICAMGCVATDTSATKLLQHVSLKRTLDDYDEVLGGHVIAVWCLFTLEPDERNRVVLPKLSPLLNPGQHTLLVIVVPLDMPQPKGPFNIGQIPSVSQVMPVELMVDTLSNIIHNSFCLHSLL